LGVGGVVVVVVNYFLFCNGGMFFSNNLIIKINIYFVMLEFPL
jgi:hypothetical protein